MSGWYSGEDDDGWDENNSKPIEGFATYGGGMRRYRCGGSTEERCDNMFCEICDPPKPKSKPKPYKQPKYDDEAMDAMMDYDDPDAMWNPKW